VDNHLTRSEVLMAVKIHIVVFFWVWCSIGWQVNTNVLKQHTASIILLPWRWE